MTEQTTKLNIPKMSVGSATEILATTYVSAIKNSVCPKHMPSVMMWGPPGVGKSQAVRQIAKIIERETNKDVSITDVRLLLFNPIDLRGIPTANADKTLAIWLKPQIFQMDENKDKINILFLDEISAAPQSVQAAAYQITLDRVVGEHKLPDNCIVIAAGNRVTDKSVSFKMPKALANRLLHIEIEGSYESWNEWAIKSGINEKVVGYLASHPDRLFGFDPARDDLAFATPRSWEMVSNILNNIDGDVKKMYPLIAGLIGVGIAIEFMAWIKVFDTVPNMIDVFSGVASVKPTSMDSLYATVSSMSTYARGVMYDKDKIGHSLSYAESFPSDFRALLLANYSALDKNYDQFLSSIPEYYNLARKSGVMRNGSVD